MGWKDIFRELKVARKQREEEEKRQDMGKRRKEKEHKRIVKRYSGIVGKVVKKFCRSIDYYLTNTGFEGKWGYELPTTVDYGPGFIGLWVRINDDGVSVAWYDYHKKIPFEDLTEYTLAIALAEAYKKNQESLEALKKH